MAARAVAAAVAPSVAPCSARVAQPAAARQRVQLSSCFRVARSLPAGRQLASQIVDKIFMRFPSLRPEIMDIIVQVLQGERDRAREIMEAVIDSEQNYLFTNDHDYKENRSSIVAGEPAQPQQYD